MVPLQWPQNPPQPLANPQPNNQAIIAQEALLRAKVENEKRVDAILANPQELFRVLGGQAGLTDHELKRLESIIDCESKWNPKAQNDHSSAAGLFQIIKGTWQAYSAYPWSQRYDAKANIETGLRIYQASGVSPWACA